MPVVRSSLQHLNDGLVSIKHKGDKTIFTHAQHLDPVYKDCFELRKRENKGFSKKRTLQHIARIPALVFFAKPELMQPDGRINKKEFRKFLRSEEGAFFRTSEGNL